MSYEEIENKVALITGGSEGIGFGIAKAFVEAGAKVAITGLSKLQTAKEKFGDKVLTINADITKVRGLFALTQAAIPELKKTHGNIINIGSVFGFRGMPIYSVYSASKAAVIMLTQLWAKELAPDVRVNTISPGGIDTAIFKKMYGEEKHQQVLEFVSGRHLMKRMGQPEEIARMALYLATENWVTGSNFVVDGGLFHLI